MNPYLLFGVPLVAPVARMAMMLLFALTPNEILGDAEQDRGGNRAIILPLAGFSFSALLALVVLDSARVQGLRLPIGLLLASFLAFYTSLNLQSYKVRRWQDQLATGLKESGSGWLLMSVVAVVNTASPKYCLQRINYHSGVPGLVWRFTDSPRDRLQLSQRPSEGIMTDDEEERKKDREVSEWLHQRAEEYSFCSTHNRRYPQGAQCPSCVAEMKKKQ